MNVRSHVGQTVVELHTAAQAVRHRLEGVDTTNPAIAALADEVDALAGLFGALLHPSIQRELVELVPFVAITDDGSSTYLLTVNPRHVVAVTEYVSQASGGARWALLRLVRGVEHRLHMVTQPDAVRKLSQGGAL